MLRSLLLRARPGRIHDGPVCYIDGNGLADPRHGYYALSADGRRLLRPYVRVVAVTHEDGSHHYEVGRKRAPHQRPYPGQVRRGQEVPLAFEGEGQAELAVGAPAPPEPQPGELLNTRDPCGSCGGICDEIASGREDVHVYRCRNCGAQQEYAA